MIAHGHEMERTAAPHEEMFRRMGRGEVDVLVSAWLPTSHGRYLAPFAEDAHDVTVLYEPHCLWGVADFVPEDAVAEVADLLRPPALDRMECLIQGINPGAGISRFSSAMVVEYGLSAAGYEFRTGAEEQCFGRFEDAVAKGRWVVIPPWHPQWLHHRYRIRELREPKGAPRWHGSSDVDHPQGRRTTRRSCGARGAENAAPRQRPGERTRRPVTTGQVLLSR
ncbi:glycine betaine ABC transporter substrate-binding protein [Mycobacterium sp. URHB0021]